MTNPISPSLKAASESTRTEKEVRSAALIAEFVRCLGIMSHSRAGWDYELSREQRAKEDREERESLARARAIWSENPDRHEELRAAFKAASPLARMEEIEKAPHASL